MNKLLIGLIIVVVLVIILGLYYFYGMVESKFEFKQGLDIFGNDLPLLNLEFKTKGNTIKQAMEFALSKPNIVGFVRLNTGEIIFKSAKTSTYTPCVNGLCTLPDSGLYLKK